MRQKILILVLSVIIIIPLYSDTIGNLIMKGRWQELDGIFIDKSYLQLNKKFGKYLRLSVQRIKKGKLKYFVKFERSAEIGFIEFKKENGKYYDLKIKANFYDMQFINGFEKYSVRDKTLKIGDANIRFKDGFIYRAMPFESLIFFKGNYRLEISPNDVEEQKTIGYLYKSGKFIVSKKKCMFVINDDLVEQLLQGIKNTISKPTYLDNVFIQERINFFKKEYGVNIPQFREYWYSPFSSTLNMIIFRKNNSHYKFVFNRNNIPDTYLFNMKKKKHILNYNHIRGMKLFSASSNKVKKIQLNIRINPYKFKIWSTALLIFPKSSSTKSFEIFKNMEIHDFYKENGDELDYLRYGDKLHILGKKFKDVSFYYSGKLNDSRRNMEILKYKFKKSFGKIDDYIFFDNENKFYPNPGNQFFESTLRVSIPLEQNCLASGVLEEKNIINDRNIRLFKSEGTKGLTIVCGKFVQIANVKSKLPLSFFASKDLNLKKYFKIEEIKKIVEKLIRFYGKRDIEKVNILIRRWFNYGGISYKGFIVFNVVKKNIFEAKKTMIEYFKSNPVFLTNNVNRDNLVHELAHQWWGGIISWKTYKDVWITEGGAQFSALLYLESILTRKKFRRIIKKIIRRIRKDSIAGPLIYGNRIGNITEDQNTYQSLIYNKSAMIFFMYREIIGKKKLFKRINSVFSDYHNKSISTRKFIDEMISGNGKDEKYLKQFFNSWIFNRDIPRVKYCIKINKKTANVVFEQVKSNFVFPLEIIVETISGRESRKIIVKNKMQEFIIVNKNLINKIKVENNFSPVYLKEVKNGR